LSLFTSSFAANGILSGAGIEVDPYLVEDYADLGVVKNDLTSHYKLTANIDASPSVLEDSSSGFYPIGNDSNRFSGVFYGNGSFITGLNINRPEMGNVGLFGVVDTNGKVLNLGVKGELRGGRYKGMLAGLNYGFLDLHLNESQHVHLRFY
jgi:hypothetical protein